jgi:hypothetical protein
MSAQTKTNEKLEFFLSHLHTCLSPIPMSERAEIVTEMKSHVLDSIETHPSQSIEAVLAALGEPEQVANRYLVERGLKPVKPSKNGVVKWLTIGFLGTFALMLLFIGVLVVKFTPLIQVNEKDERVVILGGLIDIDGKGGKVKIGNTSIQDSKDIVSGKAIFSGKKKAAMKGGTHLLSIQFQNGQVKVSPSLTDEIDFSCLYRGEKPYLSEQNGMTEFHMEQTSGTECEFKVPTNLSLRVKGENGQIVFTPEEKKNYRYNIHVSRGMMDNFSSSSDKNATEVELRLENGQIKKL